MHRRVMVHRQRAVLQRRPALCLGVLTDSSGKVAAIAAAESVFPFRIGHAKLL